MVVAITPWNFPIAIPAGKIAPALAYGNTVVWKPAELMPLTSVRFVEALNYAGLPPGVLNLVPGRGSVVGNALVAHPSVSAITFTGSNSESPSRSRSHRLLVFVEPKTEGSRRTLVVPPSIVERLRDHAKQQLAEKIWAGSKWVDNDVVFANRFGGPMQARTVIAEFHKALQRAGLPQIRFHVCQNNAARERAFEDVLHVRYTNTPALSR